MIIAFESASSDPSLALASRDGGTLATDGWVGEGRQASELLPRLLTLLERAGLDLRAASALAVGIGPGSFTGLRVSMSLAKGLALALDLPLVGVPSLEAWLAAEPEAQAAVSRAGAQEAYLLARDGGQPRVVGGSDLAPLLAGAACVAASELAIAFGLLDARTPRNAAAAVASMAAGRLAGDPAGDDLDRLEPAYLRGPRGLGQVEGGMVRRP